MKYREIPYRMNHEVTETLILNRFGFTIGDINGIDDAQFIVTSCNAVGLCEEKGLIDIEKLREKPESLSEALSQLENSHKTLTNLLQYFHPDKANQMIYDQCFQILQSLSKLK